MAADPEAAPVNSASDPAVLRGDPRTRLAAERTLLAWIRTSLAMMGFGFVVARFGLFLRELTARNGAPIAHSTGISVGIGTTLVILGALSNGVAARQHVQFLGRLERGEAHPVERWPLGTMVALALAVLGAGLAVYLVVVRR